MSNPITTANWAHRTIRRLDRFTDVRDDPTLLTRCRWAGDGLVGVYSNPPTTDIDEIVVTERCLIACFADHKETVLYENITKIRHPDKGTGGALAVWLRNGQRFTLTVAGREGRFEDAFEFGRFLQRVVNSQQPHRG